MRTQRLDSYQPRLASSRMEVAEKIFNYRIFTLGHLVMSHVKRREKGGPRKAMHGLSQGSTQSDNDLINERGLLGFEDMKAVELPRLEPLQVLAARGAASQATGIPRESLLRRVAGISEIPPEFVPKDLTEDEVRASNAGRFLVVIIES
eukprot:637780-Amorphochlora_amoeboformis.AAC.1